ncbi:helix-turn-helix domain-containing protein [Weeksella sp. HMSC059D05]|uniref:helix-turn-helix domain-containing protein n=1 Tax=Weeksella sp. HMSC059D05 TaxID=1715139 RepID=UPI0008A1CFFA|nr:helix-turn-helix domain-containing protein [Weeksella sp. HMSC059D05]OFM81824.1 hypothetical protein HMPREF2660_05585 [Weeksella sp. HMSC059D05]
MNNFTYSEHYLQVLRKTTKKLIKKNVDQLIFTDDDILSDEEVMKILKISKRSLFEYRKKGFIQFIKIGGRYYYIRLILYLDLLQLYQVPLEKEKK